MRQGYRGSREAKMASPSELNWISTPKAAVPPISLLEELILHDPTGQPGPPVLYQQPPQLYVCLHCHLCEEVLAFKTMWSLASPQPTFVSPL